MRPVLATVLALLLFAPASGWAQITTEKSEVTGTARIVSTDMRSLVTETYPGHASFRAEYEMAESDSTWKLNIYGFAETSTDMSESSRVELQGDGQPIPTVRVTAKTRTLDNSVMEIKYVALTREAFGRLATADRALAVIGPYRFELTKPLRKDLRLILERVPKDGGPPTAGTDDTTANR